MDNLIKELVEEFKKERGNLKKKTEKLNKEAKIVAKVDEKGNLGVLEIVGNQTAVLGAICGILKAMEKCGGNSAERMATIILTALEMEKEINE